MDRIDQIRANFFDALIEEGKKRVSDEKRKQAMCIHRYTVMGPVIQEWQQRECDKCGHEAVKRLRAWERAACMVS